MPRARLKDVAERAGVSMKTVSNVINDFPHVTDETRRRVLDAVEALSYRPNLSARNLARGRTGVIALAVPELDMPYFAELSRYVIEAAAEHSWIVLVEQTLHREDREEIVLSGDLSRRIDGLIFNPVAIDVSKLTQRDDATPLVLLGENLYDTPYDHVSIDNVAAARAATEHLLSLGCRRIGAIGARLGDTTASRRRRLEGSHRQRLEGYRQALRAAGIRADRGLIRPAPSYRGEYGASATEELLRLPEPPDAIFCFTDWLALGALRTLRLHDRRVPDDIAIVGFDDIPYGRVAAPSLTTISPDRQQIAKLAVDLLAQRLETRRPLPPRAVQVDFELIVRESTTRR